MRQTIGLLTACVVSVLFGCNPPRALTPADFAFITTNTLLSEVESTVGPAQRQRLEQPNRFEKPTILLEWDLGNSGSMFVCALAEPNFHPTNKILVKGIMPIPKPQVIDFSTNRNTRP
jgi:hypothetical protein